MIDIIPVKDGSIPMLLCLVVVSDLTMFATLLNNTKSVKQVFMLAFWIIIQLNGLFVATMLKIDDQMFVMGFVIIFSILNLIFNLLLIPEEIYKKTRHYKFFMIVMTIVQIGCMVSLSGLELFKFYSLSLANKNIGIIFQFMPVTWSLFIVSIIWRLSISNDANIEIIVISVAVILIMLNGAFNSKK